MINLDSLMYSCYIHQWDVFAQQQLRKGLFVPTLDQYIKADVMAYIVEHPVKQACYKTLLAKVLLLLSGEGWK